jgi:hypothetical protein
MIVNKGADATLLLRAARTCASVLSAGIWEKNLHEHKLEIQMSPSYIVVGKIGTLFRSHLKTTNSIGKQVQRIWQIFVQNYNQNTTNTNNGNQDAPKRSQEQMKTQTEDCGCFLRVSSPNAELPACRQQNTVWPKTDQAAPSSAAPASLLAPRPWQTE